MTLDRAQFALLADLPRLDPQGLAALLGPLPPADHLETLRALMTRLPGGLAHAEAIHVVAQPPSVGEPLAPGSSWFALERELAVVAGPTGAAGLLRDIARYARLSCHLVGAAEVDPDLQHAPFAGEANGAVARLAAELGTSVTDLWSAMRSDDPRSSELATLVQQRFEAPIHIHPHVRPGWLAEAGRAWARELRARCPVERPWIVLTSGGEAIELMSPYARDLSAALGQWAAENPEHITVEGLREAWPGDDAEDLAALVTPDLFAAAPDLLAERRANELTQGMFIEDRFGAQAGLVDLARSAAPDRRAVPVGTTGSVLIASGGPPPLLEAMVGQWLSEPVAGVAIVWSTQVAGDRPLLPEVVADDQDAFWLPGTEALVAEAAAVGCAVTTPGILRMAGERVHAPLRILGRIRRGQLCGEVDEALPMYVAFVPSGGFDGRASLASGRSALDASRLVLRRVADRRSDRGHHGPRGAPTPGHGDMPRRFRA